MAFTLQLTLGEFLVLLDCLDKSLEFGNWRGYSDATRKGLFDKIINTSGLFISIGVEVKDGCG